MIKVIITQALKAEGEIHMESTLKGITIPEDNEDISPLSFNEQIANTLRQKTTRHSTGNYSARSLQRYGRSC